MRPRTPPPPTHPPPMGACHVLAEGEVPRSLGRAVAAVGSAWHPGLTWPGSGPSSGSHSHSRPPQPTVGSPGPQKPLEDGGTPSSSPEPQGHWLAGTSGVPASLPGPRASLPGSPSLQAAPELPPCSRSPGRFSPPAWRLPSQCGPVCKERLRPGWPGVASGGPWCALLAVAGTFGARPRASLTRRGPGGPAARRARP